MDFIVSIVTPSYNRAHCLNACYESLKKQTSKAFEWIIVDDGSSDNTEAVVMQMVKEADFKIKYVHKENGGKHTAMNASHPYVTGEYVLILDSDDFLTEDAVEKVIKYWDQYKNDSTIGTLIFLRGDYDGNPRALGKTPGVPDDYRKLRRVKVSSSDCCEVFRSDLFIKYPYTVYEGERFISESELWNTLAEHGYKCVYINEIIYVGEYLAGGLSDSGRKMRVKNPLGGMHTSFLLMDQRYPLMLRLKKGILYVCYGFFADLSVTEIINRYKGHLLMKLICLLPGFMMYSRWKKKYCSI